MKRRMVNRRRSLADLGETMEYLERKGYTLSGADQDAVCFHYGTEGHTYAYIEMDDPRAYLIPEETGDNSGERRLRRVPVKRPVGSFLSRLTLLFLTHEAHRRYVEPAIRDMQVEYLREVACGRIWHARWVAIRGHLRVIPGWVYGWITRAVFRIRSL